MRFRHLAASLIALALPPLFSMPADCGTAAVLTSGSGPYLEAFSGFREEYGEKVPIYDLSVSAELPREDIIVTFGGKAAILDYPETSLLVYCMAPGIKVRPERQRTAAVSMMPAPGQALRTILKVQPGLRRLAVFHAADAYSDYLEALSAEGERLNLKILPARVRGGAGLPVELRRLLPEMDAFWLFPDPLIINNENFTILRDFSRANRVPFFAPTAGLAGKGATAAVYNSFTEIGRTAAKAAKKAQRNSGLWYPEKISYSINTTESAYIKLKIPEAVMNSAETLFE